MCGIAGIINKNGHEVSDELVRQMTDTLVHRGPDGEGQWSEGCVGLGHRRLKIIDLSDDGRQPMLSRDGRYVIVFNGEIYNYLEIKSFLLEKGVLFHTATDTEVILEAYRRWGESCVTRFNGMWAFAIYDRTDRSVLLSRDRMGVKPLCYLNNSDSFVFASEAKAILKIFPEEAVIDKTAVWRYFSIGRSDMDDRTFYENIKMLEPAQNLIYDLNKGHQKITTYWRVDQQLFHNKWVKGRNPVKQMRILMEDAVRIRMRSDVPIGTSLSGGIDSSTIVGIMSRKFKTNVRTFSSVYSDKECNEKEFIDEVNSCNRTTPTLVYPEDDDRMKGYKEITWHHEGPSGSASLYSGYSVYKEAQKSVTVLLDGQGADELFGGYLPYEPRIRDLLKEGGLFGKLIASTLTEIYREEWEDDNHQIPTDIILRLYGMKGVSQKKEINHYGLARELFSEKFMEDVDTRFEYDTKGLKGDLNTELYRQLRYTSLPDILHNVDGNSMRFSLEVRCPFLDYRIVEFALGLSGKYKIRNQWTKWIVRKAMRSYLPAKVCYRTDKMGFPAPFGRWLLENKDSEVEALLEKLNQRGIFNSGIPQEYYKQHMSGRIDRSIIIYKMVTLEIWLEQSIDRVLYK